jgi:hypothetical protein
VELVWHVQIVDVSVFSIISTEVAPRFDEGFQKTPKRPPTTPNAEPNNNRVSINPCARLKFPVRNGPPLRIPVNPLHVATALPQMTCRALSAINLRARRRSMTPQRRKMIPYVTLVQSPYVPCPLNNGELTRNNTAVSNVR